MAKSVPAKSGSSEWTARKLGVISLNEALNLARQHGVDLVEIAAAAVPRSAGS